MIARLASLFCLALAAVLMLAGCERTTPVPEGPRYSQAAPQAGPPVYRLAVHPLHNPQRLAEAYQPLIDHLNRQIEGARFELEASRDYQAYEAKFRAREPAFLLPNPWQSLEAMKVGYQVLAMAGDAQDFKGIFVVRKDSAVRRPADLRGKIVSYPSPTALAASMLPQYFLHSRGIDVTREIDNRYVGSQESAIMNAYLKKSDAAATWPPPWRLFQRSHPQEAAQMQVIWETPPLLNNSVMARDDVPPALRERVREVLLALQRDPQGEVILAAMEIARFHPADDASYEPVRAFIARFEREVRPVETR